MTELADTKHVTKGYASVETGATAGTGHGFCDAAAFAALFENIAKNRSALAVLPNGLSCQAVETETSERQGDDGSDRETSTGDGAVPRDECVLTDDAGCHADGGRPESGEDLAWFAVPLDTGGDRRVFSDFEAAGLPRGELSRLARELHNSAVAGRSAISIGLHLPELGELRFDVRIQDKTVFIHAFVKNERAASALALAISTLRDKLAEHDLLLGRLDVTTRQRDDDRKPPEPDKRAQRYRGEKTRPETELRERVQLENEDGTIHVLA